MKKKFLALALFPLLLSSLTGCEKKAKYNIGILQWVPIEALTKATNGFKKAVKKGLGSDNVAFEVKNAQADTSAGSSIISTFVSKNKSLIMGNATPSVKLAAAATATIPVVGTSVTSYEVAFNNNIPSNVTGTSDLADLEKQAKMIFDWYPDATKVGILYCQAEPNSKYQYDHMLTNLKAIKPTVSVSEITFATTEELTMVLNTYKNSLDVLFVPTDDTCANNAEAIHNICKPAGLPVFAGEAGICAKCGLATLSIDYFHLGEITGQMAVEILKNGKKPSEMPIQLDESLTAYYNASILAELGLSESDIPEGYIAL